MKHFSLLTLLLVVSAALLPARTQAQAPDSLGQKLRRIFAHVDLSQVPTGCLYEAGIRFVEPRHWTGLNLTDSSRTTMDLLRYLRVQFVTCRVAGPADTLPGLPAYNARLDAASASILSFG